LGAIIAVGILYGSKIGSSSVRLGTLASDARQMMSYGLPAFTGTVLSGIWPFYLSGVLATVATDAVIGYYQAASNFTIAISLLSSAAASALFPAFTSLHGGKGDLPTAFKLAVKYVGYVTIPVIFVLAATAKQLMVLFYGQPFGAGTNYLVALAVSATPVLLGLTVLPAFFNGIARTRLTLLMVGIGAIVLFAAAPILAITLNLGVYGLIYGLLLSNLITSIVGLFLFRVVFSSWVGLQAAASTLVAGVISYGLCLLVPSLSSNLLILVIKLAIFTAAYLTLAPLLRAVRYGDLETLEVALGEMPVLGRLIHIIIAYEKLLAGGDRSPAIVDQ
jgi:O-antigen/teichoic acid export membrane protein